METSSVNWSIGWYHNFWGCLGKEGLTQELDGGLSVPQPLLHSLDGNHGENVDPTCSVEGTAAQSINTFGEEPGFGLHLLSEGSHHL